MSLTKINFSRKALPNIQWNGDVSQLLDRIIQSLDGELEDGALVGQIGGSSPPTNIGLWLNGNTWYNWSNTDGRYLPFPVVTGSTFHGVLYTTQLVSNAEFGNIALNLPDQNNAMLATLDDLKAATPIKTASAASGGTISFDWTGIGNNGTLYAVLSGTAGAVTVSPANAAKDGQTVHLYIEQNANATSTPFTITWPATWIIKTGAVLTNRSSTTRIQDHFLVRQVGTSVFVDQLSSFGVPTSGGGSDTTPPTVTSIDNTAGNNTIEVTFNESLTGSSTLLETKWTVKKNGATNTVNNATASGNIVTLTVANTYTTSDTGTVQYVQFDVADLAGNLAASFGPSALNINAADSGGDGHAPPGGGGHLPP